jgi:hypothetical protein
MGSVTVIMWHYLYVLVGTINSKYKIIKILIWSYLMKTNGCICWWWKPLQYSYDEGEGVLATRYSDTEVIVCLKKEIKE